VHNATLAVCHTVWRFTAINLMTWMLVLAGAVVLGTAPALAACCWAVSRRDDRSVAQLAAGMWQQWRAEFVRANLALLPVVAVSITAWTSAPHVEGPMLAAVLVIAVLSLQFALATVYAISQVEGGVTDALGNACRLFLGAPLRLFALLAIVAVLCPIAIAQPLLALYGLLSVAARAAVALLGPACPVPSREVQPPEIRA